MNVQLTAAGVFGITGKNVPPLVARGLDRGHVNVTIRRLSLMDSLAVDQLLNKLYA